MRKSKFIHGSFILQQLTKAWRGGKNLVLAFCFSAPNEPFPHSPVYSCGISHSPNSCSTPCFSLAPSKLEKLLCCTIAREHWTCTFILLHNIPLAAPCQCSVRLTQHGVQPQKRRRQGSVLSLHWKIQYSAAGEAQK